MNEFSTAALPGLEGFQAGSGKRVRAGVGGLAFRECYGVGLECLVEGGFESAFGSLMVGVGVLKKRAGSL